MELEVLVATMNREDFSLVEEMNLRRDAVIANQCGRWGGETLEQGAARMRDPEEAALLLYRAGSLCCKVMHEPAAAARFFELAASRYADTAYGRQSATFLKSLNQH